MDSFGAQLRAIRVARGMVQADLAIRCGVREVTISRWERDIEFPRGEALKTIARELGCRILIDDQGVILEPAVASSRILGPVSALVLAVTNLPWW